MSAKATVFQNVRLNAHILSFVQEPSPAQVKAFRVAHQQMLLQTIRAIGGQIPEERDTDATRSLATRFRKVVQEQRLDPADPEQATACLRALDLDQRKSASVIGEEATLRLDDGREDAPHIGFDRFVQVEGTFFLPSVTAIVDESLGKLWREIKAGHPAMGPAARASAAEIRGWMNDDTNRAALVNVHVIDHGLNALDMIPPEIVRLSGLRNLSLRVSGGSALPNEMRNLHELQRLSLSGYFGGIPPFINELPALENFWIWDPSTHVLPDATFRRFASLGIRLDHVFNPNPYFGGDYYNIHIANPLRTLGIGYAHLTDAPFRLWFINTVEISYIHLLNSSGVPGLILQFDTQGIDLAFRLGIALFLGVPVGLLHLLLNASILLINLFLFYVVEPVVTLARDLLGYSRMVHIRDLQNGEPV